MIVETGRLIRDDSDALSAARDLAAALAEQVARHASRARRAALLSDSGLLELGAPGGTRVRARTIGAVLRVLAAADLSTAQAYRTLLLRGLPDTGCPGFGLFAQTLQLEIELGVAWGRLTDRSARGTILPFDADFQPLRGSVGQEELMIRLRNAEARLAVAADTVESARDEGAPDALSQAATAVAAVRELVIRVAVEAGRNSPADH